MPCAAQGVPDAGPWNRLLQRHVQVIEAGHASRVDYAGMRRDQNLLNTYEHSLSAVTNAQFRRWSRSEQMAILINAYNALTIELVLSKWPPPASIKDIGGWLSSPWRQPFFTLLGRPQTLDSVEAMLRKPGQYDDPRIHFAINCASIGCPMLQPTAYVADRLDTELDDASDRFLADRTRNRYEAAGDSLRVSKLFDWYADDFRRSQYGSVREFLAAHATALALDPNEAQRLRLGQLTIDFLPYDWRLNGAPSHHLP